MVMPPSPAQPAAPKASKRREGIPWQNGSEAAATNQQQPASWCMCVRVSPPECVCASSSHCPHWGVRAPACTPPACSVPVWSGPGSVYGASQVPLFIASCFRLPAVRCSCADAATNLVCLPLSPQPSEAGRGSLTASPFLSARRSHGTWVIRQWPLRAFPLIPPLLGICKASSGPAGRPRSSA